MSKSNIYLMSSQISNVIRNNVKHTNPEPVLGNQLFYQLFAVLFPGI